DPAPGGRLAACVRGASGGHARFVGQAMGRVRVPLGPGGRFPGARLPRAVAGHRVRVPRGAARALRVLHGRLVRPEPQGDADRAERCELRLPAPPGDDEPKRPRRPSARHRDGRVELSDRASPVPVHAAPSPAQGSAHHRRLLPKPRRALCADRAAGVLCDHRAVHQPCRARGARRVHLPPGRAAPLLHRSPAVSTHDHPVAGRGHAAVVYNPVKTPLERLRPVVAEYEVQHGWERRGWYDALSDGAGRAAAEHALAAAPAVVMVAGGDGTVRAVAEVMQGTGIPVALVPLGTGNLLARDIGAPLNDIAACVSVAFAGEDRSVDVGVAELEDESGARRSHTFMVMAGIGLDAEMAESTSAIAKKHLGWFAYVTPIARSVIANKLFHLDYRIDGGRVRSTRAHTV